MTRPVVRVLVADDHAVVREGIRHVLEREPGFAVVAEARDGAEALAQAEAVRPDVVLLDISMPGESGLVVVGRLRRAVPEARVLILSMHDNTEYVLEAVGGGGERSTL
jgi:DNA-binding NarL/FixJ family response regulator